MNNPQSTAIVLVNLGTPNSVQIKDLRRYLREFLSDPRVLVMPKILRFLLVNGLIVPFRPRKIQHAYESIWTTGGSPLKVHLEHLQKRLSAHLPEYQIVTAMRIGQPSLEKVFAKLIHQGMDRLLIVPLFPQYASATTGSIYEECFRVLSQKKHIPAIEFLPPFYNQPAFIDTLVALGKPVLKTKPDWVLFSYHSLPLSHLTSGETGQGHCLTQDCCSKITEKNAFCYRAQCEETTRLLVKGLGLKTGSYSNSFQSRLGRAEWIRPYTSEHVVKLAQDGVKNLVVFSPAFVADCVETLAEIGMEAKEDFQKAGGQNLVLVPAPNSHELWSTGLSELLRQKLNDN